MSLPAPKVINFKSVEQHSGKYRYSRISTKDGALGNRITLDPSASQEVNWQLPSKVYNLSKSFISYTSNMTAPAAKCSVAFTDVALPWVQSIQFGTMGGLNIVDLQNSHIYSKVARKIDTPIDEFEASDIFSGLTKADLTSANYVPQGYTSLAGNSLGVPVGAPALVAPSANEPLYSRSSAPATAMQMQYNVPLSAFTNTLFSMPQDMYFGTDSMYLRINTAPSSKLGYVATAANNPIVGAAPLETQPTISNLFLYLAVETDEAVVNTIKNKYNSGDLKYVIPFTYSFRQSTIGGGSQSLFCNLTHQYGRLMKRILHVVLPANELLNSAYDHSNFNGSKFSRYQTFLDSIPLQDSVINCLQATNATPDLVLDDWRENKVLCTGSAIQGPACYQLNWFHCDSFSGKSTDPSVPESQVYEGLDLSIPKQWIIEMQMSNGNFNHYSFATFLRQLHLVPNLGPQFV